MKRYTHFNSDSFAISASAGSGKTFILTSNLLSLLLKQGVPVFEILAITFTNKAASEIKNRVLDALNYSSSKSNRLISEILKDENPSAEGKDRLTNDKETEEKLDKLKLEIIKHFSSFKISTIDSFFSSIIRKFPAETETSTDLNIIEDAEKNLLIAEAFENFYEDLHRDAEYLDRISRLIRYAHDKSPLKMNSTLYSIYRDIDSINFKISESLYEYNIQHLEQNYENSRNYLKSKEFIDTLKSLKKDLETHYKDSLTYKKDGKRNPGKKFYDDISEYLENNDIKLLLKSAVFSKSNGSSISFLEGEQNIVEKTVQKINKIKDSLRDYIISKMMYEMYMMLDIYRRIKEKFINIKKERQVIDFEDIELKARNFLLNLKDYEYFRYRFDSSIKHILIDEFQDTSELQWETLKPIVETALSKKGTLCYVGDVKQAIYQFRGGTSKLFDRVKNDLKLKEKVLEKNYRSAPILIDFINTVFKDLSIKHPVYKYTEQIPDKENTIRSGNGYLYVRGFSYGENENLYNEIVNQIELLAPQVGYENIAVLCRTNSEIEKLATYLTHKKIPYITSGRRSLLDSVAVNDILNFMRFAVNPLENIHLVEILRSPIFRMGYNEIEKLTAPKNRAIYNHLPKGIKKRIDEILVKSRFQSPSDFIKSILEKFPVFDMYDTDSFELIMELYEISQVFESENTDTTIERFLEFLQNMGESLKIKPKHLKGITLETIHGAKGLEYHTVILPIISRSRGSRIYVHKNDSGKTILIDTNDEYQKYLKDIEEYREAYQKFEEEKIIEKLNILYVGLTRARSNLIILAIAPKKSEKSNGKILLDIAKILDKDFWDRIDKDKNIFVKGEVVRAEEKAHPIKKWKRDLSIGSPGKTTQMYKTAGSVYSLQTEDFMSTRTGILKGLIVHNVLKRIDALPVEEKIINELICKATSFEGKNFTQKEREAAKDAALKSVVSVVNDERLAELLSKRSYAELTVVGTDYENMIGRIDRIVYRDNEIIVLDFKTDNLSRAESIKKLAHRYRPQIEGYCRTVKSIYPDHSVRGILYFTEADYRDRFYEVVKI